MGRHEAVRGDPRSLRIQMKTWTQQRDEALAADCATMSLEDVAEKYGLSHNYVRFSASRLGVPVPISRKKMGRDSQTKAILLAAPTSSYNELSLQFGSGSV